MVKKKKKKLKKKNKNKVAVRGKEESEFSMVLAHQDCMEDHPALIVICGA